MITLILLISSVTALILSFIFMSGTYAIIAVILLVGAMLRATIVQATTILQGNMVEVIKEIKSSIKLNNIERRMPQERDKDAN